MSNPPVVTPPDTPPATDNWLSSLPEELRSVPSLSKFKAPVDVAKSYVELEKKIGNALKVPGPDSKPEDWEKLYSTLGRPESADKYEFKKIELPAGVQPDPELETAAKSWAHKAGLNPRQAQSLYEEFSKFQLGRIQANETQKTEAVGALKKDWGAEFEKNVGLAQNAVANVEKQLGVPEGSLKAELDATGLGNSPILVKYFAAQGAKAAESPLIMSENTKAPSGDEVTIREQIEAMYDPKHPYMDERANGRLREAARNKMLDLQQRLASLMET